jgi:DNA-binding MarR family transcriptional regulator
MSIGMLLKRAEQSLLRAKSAAVKPVGVTLSQYVTMSELDEHPGSTSAALARACLVTPQAMMVVLKAMEDQGLAVRTPHSLHRNVIEVHLTDVGREALDAARANAEPVERRVRDAFTPAELATFRELLTRCAEAAESG